MMSKITGQVLEAESGRGVPGVIVRAFDKDRFFDDLLGEVMTDAGGEFQLMYDESKFREFFDTAPDIFLLSYSKNRIREDAFYHRRIDQVQCRLGRRISIAGSSGSPASGRDSQRRAATSHFLRDFDNAYLPSES
jgi:hypothetical protein